MSRRKRKDRPKPKRPADTIQGSPRIPRRTIIVSALLALIGVAGLVYFLTEPRWNTAASIPGISGAQQGNSTAATLANLQVLKGRWLRQDGGYVIEIRDVEAGGKLDAAYFNPQPIKVSKAEASQDNGTVKAFIELRDVGYPGSTYMLTYDPSADELKGSYFQAAIRQTFQVVFVRLK